MVTARERWLGRTDVNPFYVVVGAGDFAVEKARDASTMIMEGKIDIPVGVRPLRYRVSNTVAQVQSTIGETADAIGKNPGGYVRSQYGRALDVYEDLGIRGHKVVAKMRGKAEQTADDVRRAKDEATRDAKLLKEQAKGDVRELKDEAKGMARELGGEAEAGARRTAAKAGAKGGTGARTSRSSGSPGSSGSSGGSGSSGASASNAKSSRGTGRSGSTAGR
ncbi:hypothetical protein [Streptodolium elevatio]|uniref:Uncharacterized protein n=1 Tax=Streptodolium elevatio TaxID=3157996 RepID=A0ABV3DQQ1_9ACTN